MGNFNEENNQFFNGFYRGLVENNGFDTDINGNNAVPDPLLSEKGDGRVQVRVVGIHSFNKEVRETEFATDAIPTEHLAWAEQASSIFGSFNPTNKAGISQVPEVGSYVWLFFENGNHNKPVYFASVVGVGDFDSDFSNETTIITTKGGHKITIVDTKEDDDGKLQTKLTCETAGGHTFELSDEEDSESITLKHSPSESEVLIDEDGSIWLKTAEDDDGNESAIIISKEDNEIILSSESIFIDGQLKTGTGGHLVYADTELDNENSDENVAEIGQLKIAHRLT
jgi:hypothetical protein